MAPRSNVSLRSLLLGAGLLACFAPSAGCSAVLGVDFVADGQLPGAAAGRAGNDPSGGSSGSAGNAGSAGNVAGGSSGNASGGSAGNGGSAGESTGGSAGTTSGGAAGQSGGSAGQNGGSAGTLSGGAAGTTSGGAAGNNGGAAGTTSGGAAGNNGGAAGAGACTTKKNWVRDDDGDGYVKEPLIAIASCENPGLLAENCPSAAPCLKNWLLESNVPAARDCNDLEASMNPGMWDGPAVPSNPSGLMPPGLTGFFYPLTPYAKTPPVIGDVPIIASGRDFVAIDHNLGFGSFGDGIPADVAARWTGKVRVNVTGSYVFRVVADDGVRLWIPDASGATPRIDRWTIDSQKQDETTLTLVAGTEYPIRLEWFDSQQEGVISLLWKTPSSKDFFTPLAVITEPTDAQRIASCDTIDNDCSGTIDDGIFAPAPIGGLGSPLRLACSRPCDPLAPNAVRAAACGTGGIYQGVCHAGAMVCSPEGTWGACGGELKTSGPEICGNFFDDDCDGVPDEAPCTYTGSALKEICANVIDDDGDGMTDEADCYRSVETCNVNNALDWTNGATMTLSLGATGAPSAPCVRIKEGSSIDFSTTSASHTIGKVSSEASSPVPTVGVGTTTTATFPTKGTFGWLCNQHGDPTTLAQGGLIFVVP